MQVTYERGPQGPEELHLYARITLRTSYLVKYIVINKFAQCNLCESNSNGFLLVPDAVFLDLDLCVHTISSVILKYAINRRPFFRGRLTRCPKGNDFSSESEAFRTRLEVPSKNKE